MSQSKTEFEVGDRVRLDGPKWGEHRGEIGVVSCVGEVGVVSSMGDRGYPTYKVGDKVAGVGWPFSRVNENEEQANGWNVTLLAEGETVDGWVEQDDTDEAWSKPKQGELVRFEKDESVVIGKVYENYEGEGNMELQEGDIDIFRSFGWKLFRKQENVKAFEFEDYTMYSVHVGGRHTGWLFYRCDGRASYSAARFGTFVEEPNPGTWANLYELRKVVVEA